MQRQDEDGEFGRIDLVIEPVRFDDATRTVEFRARPDPRRYEEVMVDGAMHYLDRYSRHLIPVAMVVEALRGVPLYALSPRIQSADSYVAERDEAVRDELQGSSLRPPTTEPAQHHEPSSNEPVNLAFISVDICSSTTIRLESPKAFDRASEILLRELMILVGQFNASVLKQTGDGFIAFLEHPSFTRQCDNTVDLGVSLMKAARALAKTLISAGLPSLDIRVGADFGSASIGTRSVPFTGFTYRSESSDAINLAVKIENSAAPGTMRIGNNLRKLLHVQWLERTVLVDSSNLPTDLLDYPVYEVT